MSNTPQLTAENMQLIFVDDDPSVRTDITNRFLSLYPNLITIHVIVDWPEAQRKLPELLKSAHVVLSDMNLKNKAQYSTETKRSTESQPSTEDDTTERTEFDGFRILGLSWRHNMSIPVILYTGYDLAQKALDQLTNPNYPVWVVRKEGDKEVNACIQRLATVAESIIWETALAERQHVYEHLIQGNEGMLNRPVQEGKPCWKSVLAAVAAGAVRPKHTARDFAEILARFLPSGAFKFSLLARMFKPGDYQWPSDLETYGIKPPEKRTDSSKRAAWEQLLHPSEIDFGTEKDRRDFWQKRWETTIKDAERELIGTQAALLKGTSSLLEECLSGARDLLDCAEKQTAQFKTRCEEYSSGPVNKVTRALRGNPGDHWLSWTEVFRRLWNKDTSGIKILAYPFCAEWEQIIRGLGYVLESSYKHSGPNYSVTAYINALAALGKWRLRVVVTDDGPGLGEFAAAFADASDVKPTENLARNHKLRLAQGLLWGYCDWRVLTKRGQENAVGFYDVFGLSKEIDSGDGQLGDLAKNFGQKESGTTHVLDFICPLPHPDNGTEVNNETLDLR